jgi:(p)ppGpp synthase/HD superfamily hydrolase
MQWPQEEIGVFKMLQRQPEIEKAIALARDLHKNQFRKSTKIPYFEHLASVACKVRLAGGSTDQVIGAFLHDAIEDQGDKITLEEIRHEFGLTVSQIVKDCTHEKTDEPYRVHKQRPIDMISEGGIIPQSHLVITCDKLHNAESIIKDYILIGDKLWDRFNGDKSDIVWYYTEMYKALRNSSLQFNNPILGELERAVRVINSF